MQFSPSIHWWLRQKWQLSCSGTLHISDDVGQLTLATHPDIGFMRLSEILMCDLFYRLYCHSEHSQDRAGSIQDKQNQFYSHRVGWQITSLAHLHPSIQALFSHILPRGQWESLEHTQRLFEHTGRSAGQFLLAEQPGLERCLIKNCASPYPWCTAIHCTRSSCCSRRQRCRLRCVQRSRLSNCNRSGLVRRLHRLGSLPGSSRLSNNLFAHVREGKHVDCSPAEHWWLLQKLQLVWAGALHTAVLPGQLPWPAHPGQQGENPNLVWSNHLEHTEVPYSSHSLYFRPGTPGYSPHRQSHLCKVVKHVENNQIFDGLNTCSLEHRQHFHRCCLLSNLCPSDTHSDELRPLHRLVGQPGSLRWWHNLLGVNLVPRKNVLPLRHSFDAEHQLQFS